jgi:hypothetical protein
VRIIYKNEPLLFVHGPPIYIRVAITEEESTSVFVLTEEEFAKPSDTELNDVKTVSTVKPSILRRITELGKPFQRQVYRPLQFIIGEETLSGEIEKIEGETIFFNLDGEEDLVVGVEMNTIEEILWRGKPFKEF